MRFRSFLVVLALLAAACGGSAGTDDAAEGSEAESNGEAESSGEAESNSGDISTEGPCSLLSVEDIERITSLTVSKALPNGVDGTVFGSCTWDFVEVVGSGVFEGEHPQLLLSTFETSEFFDEMEAAHELDNIDGVAERAFSRGPGEVIFLANGHSGQLGLFLLFDTTEEALAIETAEALSEVVGSNL